MLAFLRPFSLPGHFSIVFEELLLVISVRKGIQNQEYFLKALEAGRKTRKKK